MSLEEDQNDQFDLEHDDDQDYNIGQKDEFEDADADEKQIIQENSLKQTIFNKDKNLS